MSDEQQEAAVHAAELAKLRDLGHTYGEAIRGFMEAAGAFEAGMKAGLNPAGLATPEPEPPRPERPWRQLAHLWMFWADVAGFVALLLVVLLWLLR